MLMTQRGLSWPHLNGRQWVHLSRSSLFWTLMLHTFYGSEGRVFLQCRPSSARCEKVFREQGGRWSPPVSNPLLLASVYNSTFLCSIEKVLWRCEGFMTRLQSADSTLFNFHNHIIYSRCDLAPLHWRVTRDCSKAGHRSGDKSKCLASLVLRVWSGLHGYVTLSNKRILMAALCHLTHHVLDAVWLAATVGLPFQASRWAWQHFKY